MTRNVTHYVLSADCLLSRCIGRIGRNLIVPTFAFAIAAHAAPASAAVINGTSAAFGESVSVTTAPPVGLSITAISGPLPSVSGTAPVAYNNIQSAVSAVVTGVLSTGLLTVNAFSNVDGLLGSRLTSATATVNSLAVSILSVLGLTADTVQSFAQIVGGPGSLVSTGTTNISNLRLNGIAIATAAVAPNTVLLNVGGVTVTLNEQVMTGSGTNNESLLVNAIDVQLSNVAQPIVGDIFNRSNLLNGSILIGQSSVSTNAVANPAVSVSEPASLALVTGAMLGLGVFRKRRAA
ncbi:MAG: choice-of-anchor P family protein [Janthinobacterium lividum]